METHTDDWSRCICSLLMVALLATALLGTTQPAAAAVPGENGKISFTSTRNGEYEIYTMDPDGTGQTRLTDTWDYSHNSAWSPDGTKIAFEMGTASDIYTMNADGSGQTRLRWGGQPTWSPDGSKIAFATSHYGDGDILVMRSNGSLIANLTDSVVSSGAHPAWSPDGSKIAFSSGQDGDFEIYVMNSDGSGKTRLTSNGVADNRPDWSPDGSKIVFASYPYGDNDQPEIYVMNADGSAQTNLTKNPSYDQYPAWSPDGTRIAFASYRGGPLDIYTMNPDGTGITKLTSHAGNNFEPSWQPMAVANQPPTVNAGDDVSGNEGSAISLSGTGSDADAGTLTYSWSYAAGADVDAGATCSFADPTAASTTITCTDDGAYTATLAVQDGANPAVSDSLTVAVGNVAPTATFNSPSSVGGGTSFIVSLADPDDPSSTDTQTGFTYAFDCGGGYGAFGSTSSASCTAGSGTQTVGGRIRDKDGGVSEYTASVLVTNVAPTINSFAGPTDPRAVNTSVNVSGSFSDADTTDTHTATIDWGDGTSGAGIITKANGSDTVSGSHTYSTAGVYTLTLTVTDDDGATDTEIYQYAVVYDPTAGFVTGGGWINSPTGAYAADPTLTGKANFGFVSKYEKGATTPSGRTQFQFHAGDLAFRSSSYQWLVISGTKAQYKGSGTINGTGDYGFLLTANDGQVSGGGGVDKFRIKIWEKASGSIVYDNQMTDADDGAATDAIEGGSIVIHK